MTHDTETSSSNLNEIANAAAELAELRETADGILAQAWTVERTRELLDGPDAAFDSAIWDTVAELGWRDVLVPETNGGGGGSLRELCVLTEAAGAAALPVPLATAAAAAWCTDRCCNGISLILDDLSADAVLSGSGVTGRWPLVPYGAVADQLVVLAQQDGEPVLGTVDPDSAGVKREVQRPLDHSPAACITLESAPFEPISSGPDAAHRYRSATWRARLATVAELTGIASAANQAAIDYANVRVTFGRPIGTRQAIKHRLVDQRSAIEVARALVNRAADACEADSHDAEALVSLAVFWAIDSLRRVPEGATQVFGGIAYTWEHNAHVHLRRAATCAATLGPRAHYRAIVAQWLKGADAQR